MKFEFKQKTSKKNEKKKYCIQVKCVDKVNKERLDSTNIFGNQFILRIIQNTCSAFFNFQILFLKCNFYIIPKVMIIFRKSSLSI